MDKQETWHKEKSESRLKEKLTGSKPKMPYWDEKNDDMDSYLRRFEVYAGQSKWEESEKPCYLSALLKGKALTYFQELSEEDAASFDKVKKHLLNRFQCTEEGFRTQFRSARPQPEETMVVYLSRVTRYFDRWIELAAIGKDFALLVDLLLREQILSGLSAQVVSFLMERKDSNVGDMVKAADRYREAHPDKSMAAKQGSSVLFANANVTGYQSYNSGGYQSGGSGGRGQGQRGGQNRRGGWGYRSSQGQSDRGGSHETEGDKEKFLDPRVLKFHGERQVCWGCQSKDHSWQQCKKLQYKAGVVVSSQVESASVGVMVGVEVEGESDASARTHDIAVGMSVVDVLPPSIPTCRGTVNGIEATVMLDSGCSTVGVRKSLVQEEQFTSEVQSCRLFNGDMVSLPIARVDLDTPYFSGEVEACVIENPVCDVILGRVEGANFQCSEIAAAAQCETQGKPFSSLLTSKTPQLDVAPDKLAKMQKEDSSLKVLFDKVGQVSELLDSGTVSVVLRDGLLYRKVTSAKSGTVTWQVVVPEGLRESVLLAARDSLSGEHMGNRSMFKRIQPCCFWPGYRRSVRNYGRSRDTKSKTTVKEKAPVAHRSVPLVDKAFSKVRVDLMGPISPPSPRGDKYVLTCVDVATGECEAFAVKSVTTEVISEALAQFFFSH